MLRTILLLAGSNLFMTIAWYGHLRHRSERLYLAILVSWMIALPEYCLQVPANRFGYGEMSAFQLKVLQEIITLCVFVVFAWRYPGESIRWNYAVSFVLIVLAVFFAFRK